MERYTGYKIVFVGLLLLLFYACSPTKYIGENEYLLNKVTVKTDDKAVSRSDLKKNIRQKPNTRILGVLRFHLGMYNLSGRNGEKRFNKWLRTIGEAPVVYNDFHTQRSLAQLKLYLNNKGYYHASISDTVIYKNKKANVEYRISPGKQTVIEEFGYRDKQDYVQNQLEDSTELMQIVLADSVHSLLKTGKPLDMDLLESERERVTRMLREKGYFNFSKNFIQFYADTIQGQEVDKAHLLLSVIGNPADSSAYRKFRIGEININFDYDPLYLASGADSSYVDTTYGGYGIIYRDKLKIKPKLIEETIQFKEGELYNVQKVVDSYSRLQALNLFKFINIVFKEKVDTTGVKSLVCDVQLIPMKRQSYNVFLEGTHNSGNIGVGGNLTYNHRNLFQGGENLTFSIWGALKKEQLNENKIFSTRELGAELKFITPQFWLPIFKMKDFRLNFAPKTSVSLSYSYEYTPFYDRRVASVKFGYLWRKADKRWRYNFDLVDLNYVMMQKVDSAFLSGLKSDYIKSAYRSHLIFSANFMTIFTDQQLNTPGSYNYFRSSVESSGNLLWAVDNMFGVKRIKSSGDSYYEALGVQYAQYVKADGEYRFHHYLNRANTMVYRFFIGCGYPYGNMKVLPVEEAFYGGGANGIRAWQARTLGPGAYVATDNYPNSVGDFKLEANVEYRFKLFWLLEGALFVDIGNVWNITKYEDRKGATLGADFYRQLAIGTGTGLRLDASFFLLRFDWGIKVSDPAKPENSRFVLFDNGKWMKHTVFNIAIGYPF